MTKPKPTQAIPAPEVAGPTRSGPKGKIGSILCLMQRPEGARIEDMQAATDWQVHSVRGAIAGSIKKKLGYKVTSEKIEGVRIYRATPKVEA